MSQHEIATRTDWRHRIHEWRVTHISDRMFLLVLAFFVGLLSAVAAFILHSMIDLIGSLLTGKFTATSYNWLYLVYPVIGIYLTSLFVRHVVKDNISRYHANTICHLVKQVATESPQHMVIGHCISHHHRFWWFGGS